MITCLALLRSALTELRLLRFSIAALMSVSGEAGDPSMLLASCKYWDVSEC